MAGAIKKELLVAMFASSLIQVADDDITKEDETIIQQTGDYKLNKRITRRLTKLKADIDNFIHGAVNRDIAKWLKSNNATRTLKALKRIDSDKVSLELMAVYVLFANFADNRRIKLDPSMEWLKTYDYMTLADMLTETEARQAEEPMYNVAYEIVNILKA